MVGLWGGCLSCGHRLGTLLCAHNGSMGAQIRFLSIRQTAAVAVAVLATQSIISAVRAVAAAPHGRPAIAPYPGFVLGHHEVALAVGASLLVLTPGLWRGTHTAVSLAIAGLVV